MNKKLITRDALVYFFTLIILIIFLRDNFINLFEAAFLVMLYPLYIYTSTYYFSCTEEFENKTDNIIDKDNKYLANGSDDKKVNNNLYFRILKL